MRRKNRLVKITMDIPDHYETDEDFAAAFMATLDDSEWFTTIDGDKCPISQVVIGDFLIEDKE